MSAAISESYGPDYYASHRDGACRSACRIVPELLRRLDVRSAVDVGCGTGTWLAVLAEHGVSDVLGIDGTHVEASPLEIRPDQFLACDLREPLPALRRFDLVLCLEVAEHLPAACADGLVESLVALGPCVLFSAAIPGQGGVGHVNEQWPSYWVERFAAHGYRAADVVRPLVWNDPDVEPWYAQNVLLFADGREMLHRPALRALVEAHPPVVLPLVHPRLYSAMTTRADAVARRTGTEIARATAFADEVEALKRDVLGARDRASAFHAEVCELKEALAFHRGRAESFHAEAQALKALLQAAHSSGP